MIEELYALEIAPPPHRTRPRSPWQRRQEQDAEGFRCAHCQVYVSANLRLAGVQHRNHCPYCLWSRHLDCLAAGDRLSACREKMKPVGLALKISPKKYASPNGGELMLVHECQGCGKISANRIAADDQAEAILEVFEDSIARGTAQRIESPGLQILGRAEKRLVMERLFGRDL